MRCSCCKGEETTNITVRTFSPLLHFFPTFPRPITCLGLSVPRAQREPIGKSEQRSITIIAVTTHICISLCCLLRALFYINWSFAGEGSWKDFPKNISILCVSRINGLKQIRNRLNEVPLVKQKSNYMIGNCNNPSQALLANPRAGCSSCQHENTQREREIVLVFDSKVRAVVMEEVTERGPVFPVVI